MKTALPALLSFALVASSHAITLGQLDDFEDATLKNWTNGAPATNPINRTTGGPLGAGDNYMEINSDGVTSGGRLTVFNRSQWIGNYNTAAVTAIEADFKAFSVGGSGTLSLRLALKSTTTNGAPSYVSTTPFSLTADGAWHRATFFLDSASLTAVASPTALSIFLANPAELRIIHAPTVSSNGDVIVAQLGVDNITAIPEPGSTTLLLLPAATLFLRRRRQDAR